MTVIGFDFGLRRTGVATGNTLTGSSTPQCTLQSQQDKPDWVRISRLIREWQPQHLVVGQPRCVEDEKHPLTKALGHFCDELENRYGLPISHISEELSSHEAEQRLKQARQNGRRKKIRKEEVDALAAAIILESWMQLYAPQ